MPRQFEEEHMGKYEKKRARPKGFVPVGIAVALVLVSCIVVSAQAAERTRQEQEREAAYEQANTAALAVRDRQRELAAELAVESGRMQAAKASALSVSDQEAYELARQAAVTGQAAAYTPPPPAGFQASAYGYTGADQLAYWRGINSDVMGWLRVPGTNISHPIVQNTQDVNYYTAKGYDGQYSYNGVIWTNPATQSGTAGQLSSNTVLYGHNWTNYGAAPRIGSPGDVMFAQLTGYHWLSQAESYPYIYYSTPQQEMTFKIFACFYTELSFRYNVAEGDVNYIIQEARRRSRHTFDVDVSASDKILTLSTCTRAYGATSNQRFVVMARLLRPGESISPVNVVSNPNHKQPSVW